VLHHSKVWVNGLEAPAGRDTPLGPGDEVAVLPPVSGGAVTDAVRRFDLGQDCLVSQKILSISPTRPSSCSP
jgi:hypothetical protein